MFKKNPKTITINRGDPLLPCKSTAFWYKTVLQSTEMKVDNTHCVQIKMLTVATFKTVCGEYGAFTSDHQH